jgi:hypothetical protein
MGAGDGTTTDGRLEVVMRGSVKGSGKVVEISGDNMESECLEMKSLSEAVKVL